MRDLFGPMPFPAVAVLMDRRPALSFGCSGHDDTLRPKSGRVAKRTLRLAVAAAALAFASAGIQAQTVVTATCKDGTSFSGPSRRGACAGHKGVQEFGAATTAAPAAAGTAAGAATSPKPVTTPATQNAPVQSASPAPASAATPATPTAAGSTGGQVWVNSATKVYHCQGDQAYGKTKAGSYMTEAAAKAEGNRPSRGKVCYR